MADKAPASNNGNLGIEAYGRNDPILNRWMNSNSAEVYNYYLQYQRKAFRMFLDRQRDINEECGYPDTEEITAYDYYHLYEREPIAERVVSIFPQECWQVYPIISETGDVNEETDFELAIKELSKNLEADVADNDQSGSLYDGEEGDPLWEFLERADRLAGIGSYGAILLGIDDGRELQEPLDLNKTGPAASRHLLYMRILDETQCHIAEFETDPASRRYGRPKTYTVTIADSRKSTQVARASSGSIGSQDVTVHWTRIVHIVDTLDSSEIYHVPRMRTVYNRLYDLHKLYGGSAEMYWQAAFFGIAFETQPNSPYRLDAESINTIRDSMENYRNSLQRHLALPGVKANVLSPTVVDPTNHIDTYITAICVNKGIPKRVFMGSERGELSSSQDLRTWMSQVKRRQNRVVTPRIVIPFINRLVRCGVLPKPKSYTVDWEDIASLTDAEKAQVASQRTQAYATYVSGNVEAVMPYDRWLVDEMDYTQEEALEIMKAIEDQNTVDGEGEVNRITPDPEQQRMEQQQIEEDHFEKGRQDRKEEFKEQSKLAKQQGKAGRNISKAVTKNEQVLNAEYGTVMIDQVPFDLSHIHRVLEQTDDVLELEKEPHVTILYGMEDNLDVGALQNKLKMVRFPIYMDVEPELSIFKTSTADVLKFNVGSDQLKKLNELCKELPNVNVHPKYQAHLTVAYLKPGTGEKYVGLSPPAGPYALAAHAVTYSDKDRNKLRLEMAPPPDDDAPIPAAVAMNKGGADNQSAYFPLQFNTELVNDNPSKGVWRTIKGAKVFIEDGKITKGPKALVGKKPDEADDKQKEAVKSRSKESDEQKSTKPSHTLSDGSNKEAYDYWMTDSTNIQSDAREGVETKEVKELERLIETSGEEFAEGTEFYRGYDLSSDEDEHKKILANLEPGYSFTEKGFSAVTSDPKVAQRFATGIGFDSPVVMKITVTGRDFDSSLPKHYRQNRKIRGVSVDSGLEETLLERGLRYKVEKVTTKNGIKYVDVRAISSKSAQPKVSNSTNDRWLVGVDNKDGYDPNQPRDKDGKWTKVGGGGSSVKASDNVLTYVKALPGSTGPVLKMDADGKHYVVKTYSDAKRAINEVIANEIYRELGIEVPPAHIDPNSPNIVISEYIQNTEPLGSFTETSGYPKLKQQIQEGFVADATLANWDVVGFSKDNILVTGSGTPIRVDQGGALLFRAKGQIKPGLTEEVVELQSLLKPSVNNQTAEVFKGITQDQIQAQAKHILSKRDAVLKIAEQDPDVHNLLKNRLDWLETKYGKGATAPVPSVPTPESPLAVASNHYSQATELHSAHGLVKYVYDNRGDVHFSKMDWKKMVVTNPDGIKDGVCWFPNNNSAVNKARRELLKNILPAGVQIKISRKSAKDLIGPGHNLVSWEDLTKQAKTVDLSFLSGSSPLIVGEYKGAKLISGSTKQLESLSLSDHSSVKHGTHFDYDIPTPAPKGYESKAQQWWKELSEPERWAVKDFTASGSQEIRKSFTQGTPTITAKNLVKAISKAPTIQGRLVRHVHGSYATAQADALAAMPPGTYWADVAPMSTSRKHNGLGSGTNGLSLIIQSKTARLVEKFSSHPAEQEAIAMPKTLYRVMQVHRNSTFSGSSIKRTIVELEEL